MLIRRPKCPIKTTITANAHIPVIGTGIARLVWNTTAKAVQKQHAARVAKIRKTDSNQPDCVWL